MFVPTAVHGAAAGTDAIQHMYVATSVLAIAAVMTATLYRVLSRNAPRRRRTRGARERAGATR